MPKRTPRARIRLGQHFMGEKTSTTAEGVAVYREWDDNDKLHYYWEEWELRGFNDIDSWIEYDHFTKEVKLYEPVRRAQKIDPSTIKQNDTIEYKDGAVQRNLRVRETGEGTLVSLKGTVSYQIFVGDTMQYARLTDDMSQGEIEFVAERYNAREYDVYRSRTLSRQEQKRLLGKVVAPLRYNLILGLLLAGAFAGMLLYQSARPRTETVCTPRTVSSQTQGGSPQANEQTCETRTIYGSPGGGGSGIGK